ncbi:fumarylacetoacetate hydrolase family protein [Sphingomonas sp. MG17]|uniref:Fumarylacetoacetate hydrolase family protein n=1 Tax=Sphingomonas tagetis TaxID=2949092 RepID=A0A9X2HQI7_9SPHN|nr:fumarylacetoacetate hydrolase family protein [Sphingomonas tagetis]MCP3732606.1 fumarylacetoacetate hydrolase family protein [Sphingomonas tagetis]
MSYGLGIVALQTGPRAVLQYAGQLYPLDGLLPDRRHATADLLPYLLDWGSTIATLDAAVANGKLPPAIAAASEVDYLPPVQRPANVVCAGSNYYDHLRDDFGITDFDKDANDILYFAKSSGSLVGSGKSVRYPSQSAAFDWEIELVVVIGQDGRRIPIDHAWAHVAGYAIGLDLTARDLQFNKRQRRQFDLFGGKGFDDSAPIGPWIVPAKFVDPANLTLRLSVNGDVKQDSRTREMIWNVPELIADVSQHVTLRAGDLIFTGSPAGVGHVTGSYLKVGDRIAAEIAGIGRLDIEIVEDPDAARVWNRSALLAAQAQAA